ncbi:hypothetical protein BC830DRAFT_1122714 [Chytriomyces sp. MP71]|nr:hypothetical protein BC830DRAFT_1122714 [Chytriomyces sp. MP71]
MKAALIFLTRSMRTVPGNLGAIFYGLRLILSSRGCSLESSTDVRTAIILMNVGQVPFYVRKQP